MQRFLEGHGADLTICSNGQEAVDEASKAEFDAILMDIQMPTLDGLEAMRRLRTNTSFDRTPIIALTALAMPGDRERCLEAGANEYMSKPVSLKNLLKMIQQLMRQSE